MNQQSHGQHKAVHPHPGQAAGQPGPGKPDATDGPKPAGSRLTAKKNETVLGPFTVRDLTVFASTLILFVASLIPMFASRYNLWNLGSLFFLGLGIILPLIVTALFVARRLTPESKVRIGSLSIDQFASVVASFALAFFFLSVAGAFVPSMLVALIGSLGLFAATVLGRFIPFLAGDFLDRAEVPAHVVARESAAPLRKPSTPKEPKPAKESGSGTLAGWGKRLTAAAAGGAGAAGGASATGSAAQTGTSPTGTAHASAAQTGADLNGNRPHAGVSAGEAQHGAPQYGVNHEGAARNTAQPASTQPASVLQAPDQQASTQQASTQPAPDQQASVQKGPAQRASAQTAVATPATAGSGNAAAAAVAAGAAGAAVAGSSGTAASPATQAAAVVPSAAGQTQAAAVVPSAAEQTQAAAVVPSAAAPSSPEPPAAQATQAASVPAARESATGAGSAASTPAETMLHPQVMSQEPIGATVDPSSRPEEHEDQQVHDAFWFAVAQPRTAVDERTGMPAFVIEPGGWVLALEDRGHEFLVQHTDGRVGVLRDLSNIERG